MKKILIGSLVLTFLAACAVEQTRFEPIPDSKTGALPSDRQAEAPAYSEGDFWVFRVRRASLFSSSADAIGKGGDFEVISSEGQMRVFSLESGGRVRIDLPGSLAQVVPFPRIQQSQAKLFDFPLFVGKKWRVTFPILNGRRWATAINEVTGIEKVTTAAGTFRAFKIERLIVLSTHGTRGNDFAMGLAFWTYNYFYSPETRSVVKYSFVRENRFGGLMSSGSGVEETTEIELIKHGNRAIN